jgi:hypothetical protein
MGMPKETVVAYFRIQFLNLSEGTQEDHGKPQSRQSDSGPGTSWLLPNKKEVLGRTNSLLFYTTRTA